MSFILSLEGTDRLSTIESFTIIFHQVNYTNLNHIKTSLFFVFFHETIVLDEISVNADIVIQQTPDLQQMGIKVYYALWIGML